MERNYIAFISYRHAPLDSAVAGQLHKLIEQYRIPRALRAKRGRRLGLAFRDQEELPVSSDLSADICRALDHAEYLIVVCTPETARSPWVAREIDYFLSSHPLKNVFTVLADGEPGEVFPTALTRYTDDRGVVHDVEPLAADVRADSIPATLKQLRRNINRLFAAMIGCSYDELVLREHRRQRKRVASVLAACMAVALAFSGVLLVKNSQIESQNRQLEAVNQQLEEQTRTVQLRESELLTANANRALEEDRREEAITSAVRALPHTGDGERPYYGPAEQALFSAMDLFSGESAPLTRDTVLEQSTPVVDFRISTDGKCLATIDDFGQILCFDTLTGQVLWSVQKGEQSLSDARLFLCPENNSLIVHFRSTLEAYDFLTGRLLWQRQVDYILNDCVYHDEQLGLLAFVLCDYGIAEGADGYLSGYTLKVYSTATGEERQIDLGMTGPEVWRSYSGSVAGQYLRGHFSPDGRYFVGSYTETLDQTYTLCYFLADLETGRVRDVFRQETDWTVQANSIIAMQLRGDGTDLTVIRQGQDSSHAILCQRFDLKEDRLLWESATPEWEKYAFSDRGDIQCGVIYLQNEMLVVYGEYFCSFSLADGAILSVTKMEDRMVCLDLPLESYFGYVLKNGQSALGWVNGEEALVRTSRYYNVSARLGPVRGARIWGTGGFYGRVTDGKVDGLSYGEPEGAQGFIAVLPEDSEYQVVIKRGVSTKSLQTARALTGFEELDFFVDGGAAVREGGLLVVGPYSRKEAPESKQYGYTLLDARTLEPKAGFTVEQTYLWNTCFLPDGAGYVREKDGEILLYRNGEARQLAQQEQFVYLESEQASFMAGRYLSALRRQEDGGWLAVQGGEEGLRLWHNSEQEQVIPFPEGILWPTPSGFEMRCLLVTARGQVITGNYRTKSDRDIYELAVYDLHTQSWQRIPLHPETGEPRMLCTDDTGPRVVLTDSDDRAYLYDTELGACIGSFTLGVPNASVADLDLVADGTVLAVCTQDRQLLLYDTETGEQLLRHTLDSTRTAEGAVWFEDRDNGRLYAAVAGVGGICIETSGWTRLTDIPGLLCFVPETGTVVYRPDTLGGLLARQVPDTGELVALAEGLLGTGAQ